MATPCFTAEHSLGRSNRAYHLVAAGVIVGPTEFRPQQGASGIYFGTACLPDDTLSEVYIDIDRHGRMVGQPHFVPVGSCRFVQ